MPEPEFNEPSRMYARMMRDRAHDLKDALKDIEHEIKDAEREMKHEIKDAMKYEARRCRDMYKHGWTSEPVPRSVDEVLAEIDSYLSYLEDLPKERLTPYGDKVDGLLEHLDRVRSTLKSDPETK